MSDPDGRNVSLIKYHVEKGEHDRAKEIIEELLRNDPENVLHYLLMAYYYFLVGDNDEKLDWIEEVLSKEPENEDIIESIISLLNMGKERDFAIEILKTGLRLYPNNPIFHLQYAELFKMEDHKQAQASYEEAIRLDPQNYLALGTYAVLLYRLGNMKKAEQYEEQLLKYHPEDTRLLVDFAWIAYQRKKYKKAQFLIDEAIRLDPNDELIRKYYKIIYPSKNSFVRSTKRMNEILGKILLYPAHLIWKVSNEKISYTFLFFAVLVLEWIGLQILFGKGFYISLGIYFVILFINARIKKSMLKQIGFIDDEEETMKKQTEAKQKSALREMKQEVAQSDVPSSNENPTLSPDELEKRLTAIWNNENIASLREQIVETTGKEVSHAPSKPDPPEKEPIPMEMPKEDSKWPTYVMIAAIVLAMSFRFIPYYAEKANRPEPIDPELKESIEVSQAKQEQEEEEDLYNGEESKMVEQFLQDIHLEHVADYASAEFTAIILEKEDNSLRKDLENAQIETVIQPHRGLPFHYFLVVNEAEDTHAIIEVTTGQITDMYAENWSETDEEIEKYGELMEQMELAEE